MRHLDFPALRRVPFAFAVGAVLVIRLTVVGASSSGAWTETAGNVGPRYGHVAVALMDGRVLVAGGLDDTRAGQLSSAALVDPSTGVEATASMGVRRYQPAASLLHDGTVLVTGGYRQASAERYIPATGRWLPAASSSTPRWAHTATVLRDGRVLVVGGGSQEGCCESTTLSSAEIYDPVSDRWTPAAAMGAPRHWHTATLLGDGRVLVVGGNGGHTHLASAEIYDPSTDTWTATPDMTVPRVAHTATLLADGGVLVAGGVGGDDYRSSAEILHPAFGRWTPTGGMATARAGHTATALAGGRVLVAGGLARMNDALATAEVYDPATGRWDTTAPMGLARYLHTATLLADGRVLAVGGWNGKDSTGEVGLYRPAPVHTLPGSPTEVVATRGNESADVSWDAPGDDGGSANTSYTLTMYRGGTEVGSTTVDGSRTTLSISGLRNGVAYSFRVAATNDVGTGPRSAESNSITPGEFPGAPTQLTASTGHRSAKVRWTPPPGGGGPSIVSYIVTAYREGTAATSVVVAASQTTASVTGLSGGVRYTFRVTAINEVGAGPASAASNAVIPGGG